jgi:D-serine deaminase-like pyridoxal phosphate-dependent protein
VTLRSIAVIAVVGAAALLWLTRPRDEGGAYDDYFRALNQTLRATGPARPSLILDLDRLDHNIEVLTRSIRPPKHYRVVDKSLPSIPLIQYLFEHTHTDRIMSFNQPFLNEVAKALPRADVLLGKPMPVRAAEEFYRRLEGDFDPARQLQWLIDTPERLEEYRRLGDTVGRRMRISIEIDVGLHRGGVGDVATLERILAGIAAHPERFELGGFMGYDPHVVKVPSWLRSRDALFHEALTTYQGYVDYTRAHYPQLWNERITLNGAGSPTYRLYEHVELLNDLSVGSAMVKPTDFDIDTLAEHVPALFIATPVLKTAPGARLPGSDGLSRLVEWWDPNRARTFFMYGGYWMAHLVSPPGLRTNPLFGRSSNQEMVNGSAAVPIGVDDYVFLRPTQSEFVMLQFGDLVVMRGGKIVDHWPVFRE